MAEVSIADGELIITIKGIRKLATLKSEISVPLTHVVEVALDPDISTKWPGFKKWRESPGLKIAGTDLYGRYLGGTFSQKGEHVFWDVADPSKAIVISLKDQDFERLYIEVDDPDETVKQIQAAIAPNQK